MCVVWVCVCVCVCVSGVCVVCVCYITSCSLSRLRCVCVCVISQAAFISLKSKFSHTQSNKTIAGQIKTINAIRF